MSCETCDKKVCSNTHECTCPWVDCKNHGHCCDCIANHFPGLPNCYTVKKDEE